jgi:hypothetical protein
LKDLLVTRFTFNNTHPHKNSTAAASHVMSPECSVVLVMIPCWQCGHVSTAGREPIMVVCVITIVVSIGLLVRRVLAPGEHSCIVYLGGCVEWPSHFVDDGSYPLPGMVTTCCQCRISWWWFKHSITIGLIRLMRLFSSCRVLCAS